MQRTIITALMLITGIHLSAQNRNIRFDTCTIDFKNPQPGQYLILNIYYDLDKFGIRSDCLAQLDSAAQIIQLLTNCKFRIESHTDCRADSMYNRRLSQARADSIVAYLIRKIQTNRVIGIGMGESLPVNNCRCEGTVKSTCTEEEHQKNRRTLLIIAERI